MRVGSTAPDTQNYLWFHCCQLVQEYALTAHLGPLSAVLSLAVFWLHEARGHHLCLFSHMCMCVCVCVCVCVFVCLYSCLAVSMCVRVWGVMYTLPDDTQTAHVRTQ